MADRFETMLDMLSRDTTSDTEALIALRFLRRDLSRSNLSINDLKIKPEPIADDQQSARHQLDALYALGRIIAAKDAEIIQLKDLLALRAEADSTKVSSDYAATRHASSKQHWKGAWKYFIVVNSTGCKTQPDFVELAANLNSEFNTAFKYNLVRLQLRRLEECQPDIVDYCKKNHGQPDCMENAIARFNTKVREDWPAEQKAFLGNLVKGKDKIDWREIATLINTRFKTQRHARSLYLRHRRGQT